MQATDSHESNNQANQANITRSYFDACANFGVHVNAVNKVVNNGASGVWYEVLHNFCAQSKFATAAVAEMRYCFGDCEGVSCSISFTFILSICCISFVVY